MGKSCVLENNMNQYSPRTLGPCPCICLRPRGLVMCRSCGWLCKEQRVRRVCPSHSRTIYLMDVVQCPKCLSYPPVLVEYPLPLDPNNNI